MTGDQAYALARKYVEQSLSGAGALKGEKGDPGQDGKDGFSPTIEATEITGGYRVTVTDADGSQSFDIMNGSDGAPGAGVSGVEKTGTEGLTDTYRMSFTDGTHFDYQVKNGEQGLQGIPGAQGEPGSDGQQGIQGVKGDKGDDGYPFLIYKEYASLDDFNAADFPEIGLMFMVKSEDEHGSFPVYRYTGEGETPYSYITGLSQGEAIKGDKGDPGEDGAQGVPGKDGTDGTTYTPTIGTVTKGENPSASVEVNEETKTSVYNFVLPKGDKGEKGNDGEDGRSIESITKDENENIIVKFSDGTTQNIGKLSVDIQADFLTSTGFGNLRYYQDKMEYFNKDTGNWVETSITPDNVYIINMTPQAMRHICGIYDVDAGHYKLMFEEPADTVIDGQVACIVEKVIIRRKLGSEPNDENDGTLVATITRPNFGTYKSRWYIDNFFSPSVGDEWYYKAFPVSNFGYVNTYSDKNSTGGIVAKDYYLYSFDINQNESDPNKMITLTDDCQRYKSAFMNYKEDKFDYGSWEDAFFMPRPCMLNFDGTVAYYLDKNDVTKKEDGTPSDVGNKDSTMNAMMEFPKIWWKKKENGNGYLFSDNKVDDGFKCWSNIDANGNETEHFYMAMYEGSLVDNRLRSLSGQTVMNNKSASAEYNTAWTYNSDGNHMYDTFVFCDYQLIALLCVLISGTTDSQKAFGNGNVGEIIKTGTMNKNGLFYGKNTDNSGVKVFGIENLWGNVLMSCMGWSASSGTQKFKMTYGKSDGTTVDGYNVGGSGYITIAGTKLSGGGYVSKMKIHDWGLIPSELSGSATTKYCDYLGVYNRENRALIGGENTTQQMGIFAVYIYYRQDVGISRAGTYLSCKPLAASVA